MVRIFSKSYLHFILCDFLILQCCNKDYFPKIFFLSGATQENVSRWRLRKLSVIALEGCILGFTAVFRIWWSANSVYAKRLAGLGQVLGGTFSVHLNRFCIVVGQNSLSTLSVYWAYINRYIPLPLVRKTSCVRTRIWLHFHEFL